MAESVPILRRTSATTSALSVLLLAARLARAAVGLKPSPREQEYPPGWTEVTAPSPQIYEYNLGITDPGSHPNGATARTAARSERPHRLSDDALRPALSSHGISLTGRADAGRITAQRRDFV